MNKEFSKSTVYTLMIIGVLMSVAFWAGRYSQPKAVVIPPFHISSHDSLGVYRVVGSNRYVAKDSSFHITISYIQIGNSESVYELKIDGAEGYFGDITYERDFKEIGYFYRSDSNEPIVFKNDREDDASITIGGKEYPITKED